jgi:hypothetical protein
MLDEGRGMRQFSGRQKTLSRRNMAPYSGVGKGCQLEEVFEGEGKSRTEATTAHGT